MTMTTPKTTQQLFDQTDWEQLRAHKLSLIAAINIMEFLQRPKIMFDLQGMLDWIDCMQIAAEAEGYPAFSGKHAHEVR